MAIFSGGGGRRASRALLLNPPQVCKDLLGAIKGLDIVVIKIILTFSTIIEAQKTRLPALLVTDWYPFLSAFFSISFTASGSLSLIVTTT